MSVSTHKVIIYLVFWVSKYTYIHFCAAYTYFCVLQKNKCLAYTENDVSWNFKNLRLSKECQKNYLFEFFFSYSYSPNHYWILVLCFSFRSWNFPFLPYTGFRVRAIQNMHRVHRFLNNLHGILNCTYCKLTFPCSIQSPALPALTITKTNIWAILILLSFVLSLLSFEQTT